jgi:hypothetical protein
VAGRLTELARRIPTPGEADAVAELAGLGADLHTAWAHAVEHDRALAVRLAADVHDYAYHRQRIDLLEWGLEVAGWGVDHPRLPDALACGAAAAWARGDLPGAAALAARGVAAAGGRDAPAAARALNQYAINAMFTGRSQEAVELFRRVASLLRAAGEPVGGLRSEVSVCQAMTYGGSAREAAARVTELLGPISAAGNPSALAWAHYVLGEATVRTDPERALAAYAAVLDHGTGVDNRLFVMLARSSSVTLLGGRGSTAAALEEFRALLDQWEDLGNELSQWWVLQSLVVLLARTGAVQDAAVLAGAVVANLDRFPAFVRDPHELEQAIRSVRDVLGDTATDAALDEGAALPFAAAVALGRAAIDRAS